MPVSSSTEPLIELVAECLCKTNRFTTTTRASALPLHAICCHCSLCRHLTGGLYTCIVPWPEEESAAALSEDDVADNDKQPPPVPLHPLIARQASAAIHAGELSSHPFSGSYNFFFCSTCSSLMFFDGTDEGRQYFGVFAGVLDLSTARITSATTSAAAPTQAADQCQQRPQLLRVAHNKFLASTIDGGAMPWLLRPNPKGGYGQQPGMWMANRHQSSEVKTETRLLEIFRDSQTIPGMSRHGKDHTTASPLGIKCFCGGVDLLLHSPQSSQRERTGHSGDGSGSADAYDDARDIDPTTGRRRVSTCACGSCAKATGALLTHWTSAKMTDIALSMERQTDKEAATAGSNLKMFPRNLSDLAAALTLPDNEARVATGMSTLRLYRSSPHVQWFSCSRCSAAVFYARDVNPERVCIPVGLLLSSKESDEAEEESKDGVRLESDLIWDFSREGVDFLEECRGGWREEIIDMMVNGAEEWASGRKW